MLKYLFFLSTGIIVGYFVNSKRLPLDKTQKLLMQISVLLLLFFMGIGIGKDPDLKNKIINFGYTASIISLFTVFFSIVAVSILIRIFKKR